MPNINEIADSYRLHISRLYKLSTRKDYAMRLNVFFTHENLLYSAGVWNTTRKPKVVDCLSYLHDNGWRFGFPMDEIYNVYWLRKIMEELS